MKVFEAGSGALPLLHNTDTLCLNGFLIASASADIGLSLADKVEAHAQDDLPKFSSISAKALAGQQPVAFGDKHNPWLRALQAQPEKRVTRALSGAGAESKNHSLSGLYYVIINLLNIICLIFFLEATI